PGGHGGGCCACPEHSRGNTTAGRLASASSGISYLRKDAGGAYQPIAPGGPVAAGEAVYLRGVSPSTAPWDMKGVFEWQEGGVAKALTNKATVCSVRAVPNLGSDEQSVEKRLAFPPGVGWELPVRRLLHPVRLYNDAHMPGTLTLSLNGSPGAVKVWTSPPTSIPLLECGQTVTNGVTVIDGQPVIFSYPQYDFTEVWVEAARRGNATLTIAFEGTGPAEGFSHSDTLLITTRHDTLKVQVMAEDDYMAGLGTGTAVNGGAVAMFNVNNVMNTVAAFYAHPDRGCGIDVEFVVTPFDMPVTILDDGTTTNFYKYKGEIEYPPTEQHPNGLTIENGSMWIHYDYKLQLDNLQMCEQTFSGEYKAGRFIATNRNDTQYGDYVKLALPSRTGIRLANGKYRIDTGGHAEEYFGTNTMFRGAHVSVVNIAEETYLKTGAHSPATNFIDVIEFCVAHEDFHLIGGTDRPTKKGWLSGPPSPLGGITIQPEELWEINLPNQ
ncbi:MAG: hypothetical protein FWG50_11945, partial [Kiritimatiellaeota bacterium]|nr:hypothetical protein [Kiritimatiellota bacterium]